MFRTFIAAALLAATLSGCAAVDYTKSLFVSGISLETLGVQFEQVSNQVIVGCEAQAIPVVTCERYFVFGRNFQRVYPLTVGMWKAADRAGDAETKQKAEDVARSLAVDLTKLAVEALGAFAPETK